MRESPSIVPSNDQDVYLVLDNYGEWGTAWRETDVEETDFESVITYLLEGQYINPVRVVGFNISQGWVRDVSEDVVSGSFANDAPIRTAGFRISCKSLLLVTRRPKTW